MDTALLTAEWVLLAFFGLVVLSAAFIWFRRRHISQGRPLLVGALRSATKPRWRLGLIRFSGDRLEWFSVVGPALGPEQVWIRHELDLGAPEVLGEEIPGLPAAVSVSTGARNTWLALTPNTYTAVRSWHESSPPGFNVNVVS